MRREKHIFVLILCLISTCLLLAGCGDLQSILDTVPGDIAWSTEGETPPGDEVKTPIGGDEVPAGQLSEGFQEVAEDSVSESETIFLMEEAGDYAYNCLNEAEQLWYLDMEQLLGSFGEKCRLSDAGLDAGLSEEDIDKIFQCVLYDHPELFFVEGYSYTKYSMAGKLMSIEFSGTYTVDKETALARKEEIELAADAILSGISGEASEYDKVKYVYDTMILNTDYRLNAPDNQNIYSVFIHRLSVCQGYSKATQYLLNRLGIQCTLVLGTVETGEGHAWNLVKIDGNYYYLDTTWGDASYRLLDGGENPLDMSTVNYDYLNVTTEELLRTHAIASEIPMPACISREANYYVREGALFSEYDKEQMAKLFQDMVRGSKTGVTIKCVDAVCYEEIRAALVDRQEIFQFLSEMDKTIAFSQNDKQLSMTFWVTNE